VSPFRRKRDGEEESSEDTVVQEAEVTADPGADEPDPAAWALPADAGAVTTDAGTAPTAAAAEPVAAAESVDPSPAPETAASSAWSPPPSSGSADPMETFNEVTDQKPELLVAGAFAGAFVFARILKRITSD
jgi:hypothetical protein